MKTCKNIGLFLGIFLTSCVTDEMKKMQSVGYGLTGKHVIVDKDTLQIVSVEHHGYTLNLSNKTWIAIIDTAKFKMH